MGAKSLSEDLSLEKGLRALANGLFRLQDDVLNGNFQTIPFELNRGVTILKRIALMQGVRFPDNMQELMCHIDNNLLEWNLEEMQELMNKICPQYERSQLKLYDSLSGGITELCYELCYEKKKDPITEIDLESFKELFKGDEISYTLGRSFISNNPYVLRSELNLKMISYGLNEGARKIISKCYTKLPNYYIIDDKIYLCPYCKYPLRFQNNEMVCVDEKCKTNIKENPRRHWDDEIDELIVLGEYVVVFESVRDSIVYPGVVENELFNILKSYKKLKRVELNPFKDAADILIEFSNGDIWIVDLKDWVNSRSLANQLIENPVFRLANQHTKWEKGFIVIPNHRNIDYKNDLIFNLEGKLKNIEVFRVKEFVKHVKKHQRRIELEKESW